MWNAIKGTLSSFRPLSVEEASDLLVQYAKNNDVNAMETLLHRNKSTLEEIINAKEKVFQFT